MSKKYIIQKGDKYSKLAERYYNIFKADGTISKEERTIVIRELQCANPDKKEPLPVGEGLVLPKIANIELLVPIQVEDLEDLKEHAREIADRINRDYALGILLLVDPVRVLEEIEYELSDEVKQQVRKSILGVTKSQMDQYDEIRAKIKEEGYIRGFQSVKLRPKGHKSTSDRNTSSSNLSSSTPSSSNPIGGYDTVLDLAEGVVEKIAQVTYDEGAYPHRHTIPSKYSNILGKEIVLGRPTMVSFDTSTPNGVKIEIPFALIQNAGIKQGKATLVVGVKTVEIGGKPDHLSVNFANILSLIIDGKEFDTSVKNLIKQLMQDEFNKKKVKGIPLSPLIKELESLKINKFDPGLKIDDFDFKVINIQDPKKLDSLSVCLNFSPNNNAGNLQKVTQFVKPHWGLGVNERILKQKFNKWWGSPDGSKYRRLSKDKLENNKTLAKQGKLDEIFDPNGDIYVGEVQFSCESGYIDFSAEVTAENEILWIDIDITVTGKLKLSVNPLTHELCITVTGVDSSISCWSKFLIGLFFGFLGLILGGVLGSIIGSVVGGVVGAAVGTTVGATLGGLLGGIISGVVMPAIADAAIKGNLNSMSALPLVTLKYDWQIPNTTTVLKASGEWIEINKGEVLLGGKLQTPPLASSAVSILKDMKSNEKSVALPWAKQIKGGSPYYFVNSEIKCFVKIDELMEKPLSCSWIFDGKKIDGDGDKVLISITPSIGPCLKPSGYKVGEVGGQIKFISALGIHIQKSIQVINKDGTKGAPHIITKHVAEPVYQLSDQSTLKVTAKDVLGNVAISTIKFYVQILGDALSDWWEKHSGEYKQRRHPDDLFIGELEEFLGHGLGGIEPRVPGGLGTNVLLSKVLPSNIEIMEFQRPELAINIPGAKNLETYDTLLKNKK